MMIGILPGNKYVHVIAFAFMRLHCNREVAHSGSTDGNGILLQFPLALEADGTDHRGACSTFGEGRPGFALMTIRGGKGNLQMRRYLLVLSLLLGATIMHAATPSTTSGWKAKVAETMPLLGHRNWILIVDSAYPLQASAGVETIETNDDQLDVVRYVLGAVNNSIHVRPLIYMDAELPFVPDQDAPGASAYRAEIKDLLRNYEIQSLLHEKVLASIDETSKQFHVLVLKTKMAIPYTSVFIRLDCKYWGADAEKRMRVKMGEAGVGEQPKQ
jgi:hypothetical protein